MKKVFIMLAIGIASFSLFAKKPGTWTIIRPDGIYMSDRELASNPVKGKTIEDMAVTSGGQLWVVTGDNVYRVKEGSLTLSLDAIPVPVNRQVFSGKSKIRPRIMAGTDESVVVLTGDRTTIIYGDGEEWNTIRASAGQKDADDIEVYDFAELADAGLSQYGQILSGSLNNIPGIAAMYDEGWGYTFITEDVFKAAGETLTFAFHNLVRDKDHTVWALGGNNKQRLWKEYRGKISPVNQFDALCITTDPQGRAVIGTPTAILTIDKDDNTTTILETGASYVTFDRNGVMWYVPVHAGKEEPAKRMRFSDMLKEAQAGMNRPAETQPSGDRVMLVRYDLSTRQSFEFTAANSPVKGTIHKIVSDKDNYKYILAGDNMKGIYVIGEPQASCGDWKIIGSVLDGKDAVARNYWETSCTKPDGTFYAVNQMTAGNYALSVCSDGKWQQQPYELGDARLLFSVSCAAFADGIMYAGTNNSLYALQNGKLQPVPGINKKSLSNRILSLAAGNDNRLWVGSSDGLAVYDGKTFTYFNRKNTPGLSADDALCVCTSGDRVFAGSTAGLSVRNGDGSWTSFDTKNGLAHKRVNAVAADSKGQVFVAAVTAFGVSDVLAVYRDGKLTEESIPEKISITGMFTDADDNLWIVGEHDLTCRKANGEYVFYKRNDDNNPLRGDYKIDHCAVVNGELHVSVNKDISGASAVRSQKQESTPANFSSEIADRVNTFDGPQVFILKLK
jgi:hypothetical protein